LRKKKNQEPVTKLTSLRKLATDCHLVITKLKWIQGQRTYEAELLQERNRHRSHK